MKRALFAAILAFAAVSIVLDIGVHRRADQLRAEVDQLRVERNALKERNADLQKRVNAQAELDRRAELELLRNADQLQSALLRQPTAEEDQRFAEVLARAEEIHEGMLRWEDAGRPHTHLDGGY